MSRLFVTGDTHRTLSLFKLGNKEFTTNKELTKEDVVIITGDFGVIWTNTPDREEIYLLDWLDKRNFTTLFIGGNHENWRRLLELPLVEKFGAKLGYVNDSVYFIPNGTILVLNGKKIFCFGGATSTDKYRRKEGISWWPEEVPAYEVMQNAVENLNAVGNEVDIFITHTMPSRSVEIYLIIEHRYANRIQDPVARYLSFLEYNNKMKMWFCGHFHSNDKYGDVQCLMDKIVEVE